MAIAAVIVLHGRVEKSNFIDIQGEKKKKKKEKKKRTKKNLFGKRWNWSMEEKKAPLEREKKKRLKSERYRDRCDGGRGYGRDKREKETLASWLLNMRLFYSEAGIEWKCNKYIDIVFRGYLVALAPMSGSIGGSRLSCLGAWWWPVTGSLSDEWLC